MGRHGNVRCILGPIPQQREYVHRRSYGHELSLNTNSISGPHIVCVRARAANTGARSRVWTCYVECKVCHLKCRCWATNLALGIVCGAWYHVLNFTCQPKTSVIPNALGVNIGVKSSSIPQPGDPRRISWVGTLHRLAACTC